MNKLTTLNSLKNCHILKTIYKLIFVDEISIFFKNDKMDKDFVVLYYNYFFNQ